MKILAIQNRMGIGDTVIFLPYIQAISKKFDTPVSLLVKESSKADQYLNQTDYIDKIIFLDRDRQNKNGKHNGIIGGLRLARELKSFSFDKIFIFNSSLRFNLIAKLAGINEIYQYPLFKKTKQHIIQPAVNLIKNNLNLEVNNNPQIKISDNLVKTAISKFNINIRISIHTQLAIGCIRNKIPYAEIGADEPKRIGGVSQLNPLINGSWEVFTIAEAIFNWNKYKIKKNS